VVGILLLGLLWIAHNKGTVAPAPRAGEYCRHVDEFSSFLHDSSGAVTADRLLAEQNQFQADAFELARTGQSIGAASATELATDVAQWREAVVAGDAPESNLAFSQTRAAVSSVPGC
jgi:hypothetical protein